MYIAETCVWRSLLRSLLFPQQYVRFVSHLALELQFYSADLSSYKFNIVEHCKRAFFPP